MPDQVVPTLRLGELNPESDEYLQGYYGIEPREIPTHITADTDLACFPFSVLVFEHNRCSNREVYACLHHISNGLCYCDGAKHCTCAFCWRHYLVPGREARARLIKAHNTLYRSIVSHQVAQEREVQQ